MKKNLGCRVKCAGKVRKVVDRKEWRDRREVRKDIKRRDEVAKR